MRNNVRNYTAAFLGIVPIEKGQAIFTCPSGATSDKKV